MKYTYEFNKGIVVLRLPYRHGAVIECQDPTDARAIHDVINRNWTIAEYKERPLLNTWDVVELSRRRTRLFPTTCTNDILGHHLIYTADEPTGVFKCTGKRDELTQYTELSNLIGAPYAVEKAARLIREGKFNDGDDDLYFSNGLDAPLISLAAIMESEGWIETIVYLDQMATRAGLKVDI